MPWFEYEGLTPGETAVTGRLEAGDHETAERTLAQMGLQVRQLNAAEPPPRAAAKLGADDLIFFNEQLASLAEAGIALDEGLAQLARDVESPKLRGWLNGLVEDLRRGVPLERAIEARQQGLPLLYSRVIRAGVESGELPATLLNLNQHLRLLGNTRRIVWEMVSYPLLIMVLSLTIVSGFLMFVVPQFEEIYMDFGTTLPGMTVLLLRIAESFPQILLTVTAMIVVMVLLWRSLKFTARGAAVRERIMFALPVIGRIVRASLIARFFRMVSTTVGSGLPLPEALRLGADATGSRVLMNDAGRLADEVERGESIFAANQSAALIPPLFGFCVQVGGGRDTLPVAISQLAGAYEHRAQHTQALVRTLLFPFLVVVLGIFVFFCVLGLFLPLVTLINAVSG